MEVRGSLVAVWGGLVVVWGVSMDFDILVYFVKKTIKGQSELELQYSFTRTVDLHTHKVRKKTMTPVKKSLVLLDSCTCTLKYFFV